MAYGSPDSLADVEAYYTHIRRGRKPSAEQLADLVERYKVIGGSDLNRLTYRVAEALEQELSTAPGGEGHAYRVYVGMKHWHPYIADTVDRMAADGVQRVVAMVLTPQYSRMSVGEYLKTARERATEHALDMIEIEHWWNAPGYVEFMADRVRECRDRFEGDDRGRVRAIFTAHSLPERILQWNDPYPEQLLATSRAVSEAAGLERWHFAYQSASHTGEPWLGPDILDLMSDLHEEGVRSLLVAPIGFVSDHLEVRYDIDVEAMARAKELGMRLERTDSPNAHPDFVRILSGVVQTSARQSAKEVVRE